MTDCPRMGVKKKTRPMSLFMVNKSKSKYKKSGVENWKFMKTKIMRRVPITKSVSFNYLVPLKEYERLHAKYVEHGPFEEVNEVAKAILAGILSEKIDLIEPDDE